MNKKQVIEILEYLSMSYPNFGDIQSKLGVWYTSLKFYNYVDVKDRLYDLMQLKEFSMVAPNLSRIVAPLTKIKDKVENANYKYPCSICRRFFDDYDELTIHEERCRSVRYIVKQYKRLGLGELSKKMLYDLPEEEFQIRYNKLLRFVQGKTQNEHEKRTIECIFDVPNTQEALKVLNEGLR